MPPLYLYKTETTLIICVANLVYYVISPPFDEMLQTLIYSQKQSMQGVRASKLLYPYKKLYTKAKAGSRFQATVPALFTSPLKVRPRHRTNCNHTVWKNEWRGQSHVYQTQVDNAFYAP